MAFSYFSPYCIYNAADRASKLVVALNLFVVINGMALAECTWSIIDMELCVISRLTSVPIENCLFIKSIEQCQSQNCTIFMVQTKNPQWLCRLFETKSCDLLKSMLRWKRFNFIGIINVINWSYCHRNQIKYIIKMWCTQFLRQPHPEMIPK